MKAGDEIYVERERYTHHGIYVHDKQVIHTDTRATINCTTLEQFAEGAQVQVQQYGEARRFEPDEVVERAKRQIGLGGFTRVERFPMWCITGSDAQAGEAPTQTRESLRCRRLEECLPPTDADLLLGSMVGLAVAHARDPHGEGQEVAESWLDLLKRDDLPVTGLKSFVGDLQRPDAGTAWRTRLLNQFGQVTPSRLRVWLADQCVRGTVVSAEEVVGPYLRRLDAVLDLAAMPFSVLDAQDEYLGRAADIAAAKVTGLQTGGVIAGRLVGGYAAGYTMHPGAIGLVNKGADYVLDKLGKVDDDARVLSGLLVGAYAASLEADGLSDVLILRAQLITDIKERCVALATARISARRIPPKGLNQRIDMMQAAAGSIDVILGEMIERDGGDAYTSATGHPFTQMRDVPDVVGMSALAAQWMFEYHNIKISFNDAQGCHKTLYQKENWHVVSQSEGTGIREFRVPVRVRAFL